MKQISEILEHSRWIYSFDEMICDSFFVAHKNLLIVRYDMRFNYLFQASIPKDGYNYDDAFETITHWLKKHLGVSCSLVRGGLSPETYKILGLQ